MRRRNAWTAAIVLAIGGAWLAARTSPTHAPNAAQRRTEVAETNPTAAAASERVTSEPDPAAKSSARARVAKRPTSADGGVGPERPRPPRDGLLTPEQQARLASGEGPTLRRIEDNVRALELAVESAERAGDVASANALRARIERLRTRKAELLHGGLPPRPAPTPAPE